MADKPSRRLVNVTASADVIQGMFFPSLPGVWSRTDAGLPADARCVNKGYDWSRDQFWFTFESAQFPEVPDGAPIPYFDGMSLSCFHFENPASDKAIAELNRMTAQQVQVSEAVHEQGWAADGDKPRVIPHFDPSGLIAYNEYRKQQPPTDPDAPLVVG